MSTAVILAGGESRRMKRDKLALRVGKQTLLESAVARYSRYFDTILISVADPNKYPQIKARRVIDVYRGCGPIGGLHASLTSTGDDGIFLAAADMPFADPKAAKRIIELAGDFDICLTVDRSSRYEPLFAYYKKTVLEHVENAIALRNFKIADLFEKVKVRIVTAGELGDFWNEKLLLNINYPVDYEGLLEDGLDV